MNEPRTSELDVAGGSFRTLSRAYWLTFAACCLLCVAPLWWFDYLPMVDLPQNAAQVAIWRHWDDPTSGYSQHLSVNRTTPYLLVYFVAYLLAWLMPVQTAFTLIITVAILGVPIMVHLLLRETRGHPWWVFSCFPIGFSYAFFWGFVNYLLATPLALFFLLCAIRYAARPSWRRAVGLVALLHVLFLAHVIVFGFCGLVGGLLIAARAPGLWSAVLRSAPLASPLPLAVAWVARTRAGEDLSGVVWGLSWRRLPELLSCSVGMPLEIGTAELTLAFLLLVAPFALGAAPSRELWRWLPLTTTVLLFCLAPLDTLGTSFLYPRFAVFLLPTLLLALEPREAVFRSRRRLALAPTLAATWLLALGLRFWGFNKEVGDLKGLVSAMPRDQRVLYLGFDSRSAFIPYPVFLHLGVWYQVDNGGMVEFSFASFFPTRFRYRASESSPVPPGFAWAPSIFNWIEHRGELYDYFMVRAPSDFGPRLFATAPSAVRLVDHRGVWWLYRRADDPTASAWTKAAVQ